MNHEQLLQNHRQRIAELLKVPIEEIAIFRQMKEMKEHHLYYAVEKHSSVNHGFYQIKLKNVLIASWNLQEFPFCCAYLISGHARVEPSYRSKGLGTLLNVIRQEIAYQLGYTAMICTDVETNEHQRKLLAKQEFQDVFKVTNKRTRNNVFLSVKLLK